MSTNTQAILDAALALPDDDREMIVERLLESLPLTTDGLDDEALSAELRRRKAEHERDPSVAQPWSEIKHLR
jgi:putative addiction module component (TIGR02574 family)